MGDTEMNRDDTIYDETVFDDASPLPSDASAARRQTSPQHNTASQTIDMLLDDYHVIGVPIESKMGRVTCVYRADWDIYLAVKQPREDLIQTAAEQDRFLAEANTWISLGLHPDIVSCYFVRDIDGIPALFLEWMFGGSLKEWIVHRHKTLPSSEQEERDLILTIIAFSIQIARGLGYAHDCGVIHRDVKPSNILLFSPEEVKVSDFGISAIHGEPKRIISGTLEYRSPEQAQGEAASRQMDMYSFAVTVLEMFTGEVLWQSGSAVRVALEDYLANDLRIPMPDALKDLLRRCLSRDGEHRPTDFYEIEDHLLAAYERLAGHPYASLYGDTAAADTADDLNNRALSFLDLGNPEEAQKCWQQALEQEVDHPEALYNSLLHRIRTGQMTPEQAAREFRAKSTLPDELGFADRLSQEGGKILLRQNLFEDPPPSSPEETPEIPEALVGRIPDAFYLQSFALSRDGRFALSAEWHGKDNGGECPDVRLWDAETGALLKTFSAQSAWADNEDSCEYFLVGFLEQDNALFAIRRVHSFSEHAIYEGILVWDRESGQLLANHKEELSNRGRDPDEVARFTHKDTRRFYGAWQHNPPFAFLRTASAHYALCFPDDTYEHLERDGLYSRELGSIRSILESGDPFQARLKAEALLDTPGYQQDPYAIRLLQESCCQMPKKGLVLMRPAPQEDSVEIKVDHLPAQVLKRVEKKAEEELERMLHAIGFEPHADHSAWLQEAVVSPDKRRVVFPTTVKRSVEDRYSLDTSEMFYYGAIVVEVGEFGKPDKVVARFGTLLFKSFFNYQLPYSLSCDSGGKRLLLAADRLAVIPVAGNLPEADRFSVGSVTHGVENVLVRNGGIRYARFLSDDKLVFYFDADDAVGVIDSSTGEQWCRTSLAGKNVESVALVDDNTFLVKYLGEKRPEIWLFYWEYGFASIEDL